MIINIAGIIHSIPDVAKKMRCTYHGALASPLAIVTAIIAYRVMSVMMNSTPINFRLRGLSRDISTLLYLRDA